MKRAARIRDLAWFRDNVPCLTACPVRTDCGRYVQLIAEGRFEDAYLVARAPNPLASVCARVCAAPCEDACRRGNIDKPVTIRALKRFVCEQYGPESRQPRTETALFDGWREEGSRTLWHLPGPPSDGAPRVRVAVIGSGPAGLACAHDLAVLGYHVTVFEAADAPGGMLRFGVPGYRLPRDIIATSVATLLQLGVEFQYGTPLTRDFGLRHLRAQGYRAVFLGVGAQSGRHLPIEGHDLDGVFTAVDYLLNVNRGYRVSLGDRVVVIGGGSVALDAARTALRALDSPYSLSNERLDEQALTTAVDAARQALRAGAREVHVVSLESEEAMPAAKTEQGREELEEARREGIIFHFSRGPKRLLGADGRVHAVETVACTRVFDNDGRFSPLFAEGTESAIPADGVVLAIGQAVDLSFVQPGDGIEITRQGTIKVDPATMATTAPGVFSGGDAAVGPRIIIEAEAHGKQAALSIDRYLRSEGPRVRGSEGPDVLSDNADRQPVLRVRIDELPTREYQMPGSYDARPRRSPPTIDTGRRVGPAEVEQRYDESVAVEQAVRCLQCHVHPIYDSALCVACGRCVDICPYRCLQFVPVASLDLDASSSAIVGARVEADTRPGEPLALVKDEERCVRCGLCAIRCPTGAFTMERFSFEEVLQ